MDIKPYDKQLKQIAISLREYGWRQPIVVDKDDVIIVGHGRWMAYKKYPEGIKEPWIEKATDLTPEQVKGYRLMDNKTNESDWDMDLAIEELKELVSLGFDIEKTGFDSDLLIEAEDKDDIVPEDAPPKAKIGDLWLLGQHRVLCGDSTKKEDVDRLMDGKKADMVFTDPPYNVNYKGTGENTSNTILNDKMSDDSFDLFLTETFKRFAENSKGGAGWYVFHSSTTQDQFTKAIEKAGWDVKTQIIWNKPNASMGWGDYRMKHEPFFYCGKEKTAFYGDRTGTSVWDFTKTEQQLLNWAKKMKRMEEEGKMTVWTMKRDNVNEYVHPTQKPVELITRALINSSKEEDIVLDLFLGSGSTLIASEKTGRICYGMELDPKYVDTIVKRYEDYTGSVATLVV